MSRITDYTALSSAQSDDELVIVDVHDTTMDATGTTKKITAGALSSSSSPMTTLGDTVYENATPQPTRLPGNTTTTKKFLTQTGTGSVSAAPAWGTLAAGDVPGVDGVTVTGTPSAGQVPVATGPAAATWQTPAATDQPYQFRPETYGAKGDGRVVGDVTANATATITSASANFTSGDVGKHIMINGALGNSGPLITTISAVTNSTTVTLANAASASATNCAAVWGTDDTAAINSAVTAAGTYGLANGYYAEVVFGAKYYILATGPTQSGNGSTTATFNSQIPLPIPNVNGLTPKLVFGLRGTGGNGYQDFWESNIPNLSGTALVSMTTAPGTFDATFHQQSVVGGPSGGEVLVGGFANIKPVVTGIQVVMGAYTNQYGFDFGYCTSVYQRECGVHAFAVPGGFGGGTTAATPKMQDLPSTSAFQNALGVGIRSPVTSNNADAVFSDINVMGISYGVRAFDHFTCDKLFVMYANRGLAMDLTMGFSNTMHRIVVSNYGCEQSNTPIWTSGSGTVPVDINLDTENQFVGISHDVDDSGNALQGVIRHIAPSEARAPLVTGAAKVKIISDTLGTGYWSGAPAVPANNTNPAALPWKDAWVTITSAGGAVSAISIDGQATGLSLGTSGSVQVFIPSGKQIQLTYASTAPTWKWWLT